MSHIAASASTPPTPSADELRLRRATQDLEGVFVNELFKAMRETVPEGGVVDGGMGEEIFSGMMDQQLSSVAAAGWERGLGAALYRQLSPLITGAESAAPPEPPVQGDY